MYKRQLDGVQQVAVIGDHLVQPAGGHGVQPVSYTHLDVYKRQAGARPGAYRHLRQQRAGQDEPFRGHLAAEIGRAHV